MPCLSLTLRDGGWVKEDERTEVNRGTSKPSPSMPFELKGFAVAPLAGQIATGSLPPADDV